MAQDVDIKVLKLAEDMARYVHHSGYPRYDGGHSEPEQECSHLDCAAVREFKLRLSGTATGIRRTTSLRDQLSAVQENLHDKKGK